MKISKTSNNLNADYILTDEGFSPYSEDIDFLEKLSNYIPVGTVCGYVSADPSLSITPKNTTTYAFTTRPDQARVHSCQGEL